jgi:hypothetical protein
LFYSTFLGNYPFDKTILLAASKKGMSAHQIHRMLKVKYQTAWFMMHRLRYEMGVRWRRC